MRTKQYSGNLKFENVVETQVNALGQKIEYPDFKDAKVSMMKITFPPGESTGWHKHIIPVFSYILQGTLTIETEEHKIMEFKEGSSFAEMINVYHNGINRGKSEVVAFVIYLGGDATPLAIPKT
ncbi:cupin domain-containing protein [Flavobacterium rivuli]|nr:cupin domain-containing protein [Flavobacterium rivuli]